MENYLTQHKQMNPKNPFFMYMAYQQAHTPNQVADYYLGKLLDICETCSDMKEARQIHLGEMKYSFEHCSIYALSWQPKYSLWMTQLATL